MQHASQPRRRLSLMLWLALLLSLIGSTHPPVSAAATPPLASAPGWVATTLPVGVTAADATSLALAPDNATHAFLATASGVYTSTDAGESWTPLTTLITPTTEIVIAPSDGQRVYAWSSTLERSDDGGVTWVTAGMPDSLCGLTVAPDDADRLYARSCDGSTALARSDDGGQTWSSPAPTFTPALSNLVALNGNVLIGTDGSAVYRSADGGATWMDAPIGSGITGATLVADPASDTVYLGYASGLLRSMDRGQTWQNGDLEREFTLLIASRPNTLIGGTAASMWQIASSGEIWTATTVDLPAAPRWLARSNYDTSMLYALTDAGLWRLPAPTVVPRYQTYLSLIAVRSTGTTSGNPAQEAIAYANSYRFLAGAPPLQLHPSLVTAAQNHANYDLLNYADASAWIYGPHGEVAGKAGFTGKHSGDRALAAGFPWSAGWEVMSYDANPTRSIDGWIDTVFHRVIILNPSLHFAGYANGRKSTELVDVLDLGRGPADQGTWLSALPFIQVYPSVEQTNVPLEGASELPDAIPPGASYPIGYPVTVQIGRGSTLAVSFAELRDSSGQVVAVHPNPPGCGTTCYALIPVAPLRPATTYTAHVVGTVDDVAFDRIWSFTTTACTRIGFC